MDREELQRQLVATFRVELEEHAAALNKGLLELERDLPAGEREATDISWDKKTGW